MRKKQLILKELLELIELFPDQPIAQHLRCILRPNNDFYTWTDEVLLKKIETYRNELENDSDDEYDDEAPYYNQNIK